jgi:hypothetical protein
MAAACSNTGDVSVFRIGVSPIAAVVEAKMHPG